jgi:hypothetical protein
MRKIEQQMLSALRNGKHWKSGNMEVVADPVNRPWVEVRLHSNPIVGYSPIRGWKFSLAGWNTRTTRSRINAILSVIRPGARLYVKRGELRYYSEYEGGSYDRVIDPKEWVEVVSGRKPSEL